jgi:hypothetical protein
MYSLEKGVIDVVGGVVGVVYCGRMRLNESCYITNVVSTSR